MRYNEINEDREFDDIKDPADRWLAQYTYQSLDKWPSTEVFEELKQRYPIDKPTSIFRGMNFISKEEFDKFYPTLSKGIFETGGISSWAKDYEGAYQFSVTQPTYYLSRELMQRESEKSRQRELLSGYRGIILEMIAQPGQGIDVNKSRLGHESEIIIQPGKYKIAKIHQIKRFADRVSEEDINVDKFIRRLKKPLDDEDEKFFSYIMHHHANELSSKARESVYNIIKWFPNLIEDNRHVAFKFDHPGIKFYRIQSHSYFNELISSGYFSDSKVNDFKRHVLKLFDQIERVWQKEPKVEIHGLFGLATQFKKESKTYDLYEIYRDTLAYRLGNLYRDLEAEGRKINDLPGDKREQAIRFHAKEVERFFSGNFN